MTSDEWFYFTALVFDDEEVVGRPIKNEFGIDSSIIIGIALSINTAIHTYNTEKNNRIHILSYVLFFCSMAEIKRGSSLLAGCTEGEGIT